MEILSQAYKNEISKERARELLSLNKFDKPIIDPRTGCIPEILTEENAFFYDLQEKDGLLKVFEKVIKSKEKLSEIGQNNLDLIRKWD